METIICDEFQNSTKNEEWLYKWTIAKCRDGELMDFEEGWNVIEKHGIDILQDWILRESDSERHHQVFTIKAFSSLYTISYKIRFSELRDMTVHLYAKCIISIEFFLKNILKPVVAEKSDKFIVEALIGAWETHLVFTKWIRRLFMHMDDNIIKNKDMKTVTSLSLEAYYRLVFTDMKESVVFVLLNLIHTHRLEAVHGSINTDTDIGLLRNAIQQFIIMGVVSTNRTALSLDDIFTSPVNLSVYIRNFEDIFLQSTLSYYLHHLKQWMAVLSLPDFLRKINNSLTQEYLRITHYLHGSTKSKFKAIFFNECIAVYWSDMLKKMKPLLVDALLQSRGSISHPNELISSNAAAIFLPLPPVFPPVTLTSSHGGVQEEEDLDSNSLIHAINAFYRLLKEAEGITPSPSPSPAPTTRVQWESGLNGGAADSNQMPVDNRHLTEEFGDCLSQAVIESSRAVLLQTQRDSASCLKYGDYGRSSSSLQDDSIIESLFRIVVTLQSCEFWGNAVIVKAASVALEAVVNSDTENGGGSVPTLLSLYIDKVLSGKLKLTDADKENALSRSFHLFTFVKDKDIFYESYRDKFARRLLSASSRATHSSSSWSDEIEAFDLERQFISQFRSHCGMQYSLKLEAMLTDLQLAADLNRSFQSECYRNWNVTSSDHSNMAFEVRVLSSGSWPSPATITVASLPGVLANRMQLFQDWYGTKHKERKLQWILAKGDATVCMRVGDGRTYDLELTTLQAILLCKVFQRTTASLSYLDVSRSCGVIADWSEDVLKRLLHSLSCQKIKILIKSPESSKISDTDTFRVNDSLNINLKKVRIPMSSLDNKCAEPTAHNTTISKDRSFTIQAAIIRVMKARKQLSHSDLQCEVWKQCSSQFQPTTKAIKLEIERLIERDYLSRDIHNLNLYTYLP